jgi:hypothetical protein
MKSTITMGNDEFILYIRKNSNECSIKNDRLGRLIWEWLRDKGAIKIEEDKPCHWGESTHHPIKSGVREWIG